MTANSSDPERERAARIVALFSVLVHAWESNDFAEAAGARDELDRLGVKVKLPGLRSKRQGVSHE